jgi:hypothetical protein
MLRRARVTLVTASLLLLASRSLSAQDTTGVGSLAGVVRDEAGAPAAAARVCALDTPLCATTGADGSFRLDDLRAGSYRLEILPQRGLPVISDPIDVRAGLEGAVTVTLPASGALEQLVQVSAPAFVAPVEVKTSGFLIQPGTILKDAGALQDVSRYVQGLPGVVIGTNDFRNDIIVRGGSPLENLFIVDNVEIPNINTFANFASAGGTVSILDAELLQDVTFLTGGYPAAFGNRTSSVLQVTQREGSRERFGGWATLGFAGAGAILEGPLPNRKGSWVVSARRSFLDLVTDDVGIGGVPVLYTLNGKVVYDLSPSDRVWLVNITGVDEIRLGLTDRTEGDDELANFDIRYDGWRAATGLNWQHIFGAAGVGLLGLTHSTADVGQQVKDLVRTSPSPTGSARDVVAAGALVYDERSREAETTLKYDLTLYPPGLEKVQAGASVKTFGVRYDVRSPFGNDTPYAEAPGLDPFTLSTRLRVQQGAAYLQATRRIGSRVSVTAGGRFDRFGLIERSRLSPRASVSVQLSPSLVWSAGTGIYYQAPAFLFLTAFPENRSLEPWRADHFVSGIAWSGSEGRRVTLEGYRKNYSRYAVASQLPAVSLANIGDTFDVREILFRLASAGRGFSHGIELFAEQRGRRVYGQVNVAASRTRHAGLDGVLRPGSFDYPFVLNMTGGYRWRARWESSIKLSVLSGRPFTPFDVATSTSQRRGVFDLSRVNGERADAYLRLDARIDRTFTLAGRDLNVFAGVQNILNRRNFGGYSWNRRTNLPQLGEGQGIFPILGFDWRFN